MLITSFLPMDDVKKFAMKSGLIVCQDVGKDRGLLAHFIIFGYFCLMCS